MIANVNLVAGVLENTKHAMRILDRISLAANINMVKPAMLVGQSNSVAHYDHQRRLIVIDSGVFNSVKMYGDRSDNLLAVIIGHEYAHYVRGHDFNHKVQHLYGAFSSVVDLNTDDGKRLIGKQAETEADYYGVFYTMLAGYDLTIADVQMLQQIVKMSHDTVDELSVADNSVHPTDAERLQLTADALRDMAEYVLLHQLANAALISGQYLQASVLYEYVGAGVNVPSVYWNELLSRFLVLQEMSGRQIVKRTVLRNSLATEFRYRSTDAIVQLDVQQFHYRCLSLIDVLRASRYNDVGVQGMANLLVLYDQSMQCEACVGKLLCNSHAAEAKRIERILATTSTSVDTTSSAFTGEVHREDFQEMSALLDRYSRRGTAKSIRLSIGTGLLSYVYDDGTTSARFVYRAPRQRTSSWIDMQIAPCTTCSGTAINVQDNLVVQMLDGVVLRSAWFIE